MMGVGRQAPKAGARVGRTPAAAAIENAKAGAAAMGSAVLGQGGETASDRVQKTAPRSRRGGSGRGIGV